MHALVRLHAHICVCVCTVRIAKVSFTVNKCRVEVNLCSSTEGILRSPAVRPLRSSCVWVTSESFASISWMSTLRLREVESFFNFYFYYHMCKVCLSCMCPVELVHSPDTSSV